MRNPDPRFMELLALTGSETVVDFGSGSGHHSLMVAQKLTTGKVIASDVSKAMLDKLGKLATKRGVADRIEILQEDALNLSSVPSESADCAISLATWHHIHGDSSVLQKACNELARVLKPGGRFIVVDLGIAKSSAHDRALGAVMKGNDRPFSMEDMEAYMANAGLRKRKVENAGRWIIGYSIK